VVVVYQRKEAQYVVEVEQEEEQQWKGAAG
jgi:hypothetical protein